MGSAQNKPATTSTMIYLPVLGLIALVSCPCSGLNFSSNRSRRVVLAKAFFAATAAASISPANAQDIPNFRRIPTQFIAALGDPASTHGTGAEEWGLWTVDPGPRGVFLKDSKSLLQTGTGPYGWKFDPTDWWLEEHGIIMEQPDFPLPMGKYRVTGGRETTATLTVSSEGSWSLQPYGPTDRQPTLYDVTHLPCRSARYTSKKSGGCSPLQANKSQFPVRPGGVMPAVSGCEKQDYAVLFVTGVAEDTGRSNEL